MLYPNQYKGNCHVCQQQVLPMNGYRDKLEGRWIVYCMGCVPKVQVGEQRRELTIDGKVYTPYNIQELPLLRSLPGKGWQPEGKYWAASLAEQDRRRVLEIADLLKLKVPEEFRKIEVSPNAEMAKQRGCYPFQVEGVDWLTRRDSAILADQMGLGKTIITIMSLKADDRAILICPSGLKYNWQKEFRRWRPEFKTDVLVRRNTFVVPMPGEAIIMSFDILPEWLSPKIVGHNIKGKAIKHVVISQEMQDNLRQCVLVVDEAQRLTNYKTKRSERVHQIALLAKKKWGVTGTPLPNKPGQLFGILACLNMIKETFRNWNHFMDLFGAVRNEWNGVDWGFPKPEVPEILRRVMLRRERQEVMPDLPSKTYSEITVDLPAKLQNKLNDLMGIYDIEQEEELPDFEEFAAIRRELAEARIDAMMEYVEDAEMQGVPLVVASAHRAPIEALEKRKGWSIITGDTSPVKRQQVVDDFQEGKLLGVGLTIKSSIGTTLTRAWIMLFVDLEWSPTDNEQCADRICRIGQTSSNVNIVRMTSDHPLDRHIQNLIVKKAGWIKGAIDSRMGK